MIFQYIYSIYQYILSYAMFHTPSQDFAEDIVTPLCGRYLSLLWNQSPTREIPLHAQRTKSFFVRPDASGMEEAIGKFLDGLEGQEQGL